MNAAAQLDRVNGAITIIESLRSDYLIHTGPAYEALSVALECMRADRQKWIERVAADMHTQQDAASTSTAARHGRPSSDDLEKFL